MEYTIGNIIENYDNEYEIIFTINGTEYLMSTPFICKPNGDDLLCDGYTMYCDKDGEWEEIESIEVDPYYFYQAILTYCKQEELNQEGGY